MLKAIILLIHAAIIPLDAYLSQLHQYICRAVHLSTVSRYFNFRKNRPQKDAKILCMLFKSFWWYLVYRMTDQFCMHFSCCSAIMDCVGCEKCRLWGKLQVLGLGTALKILFSVDGEYRHDQHVSFLLSSFICRPLSLSLEQIRAIHRQCFSLVSLSFYVLQLQLQRNEVIALVNLLNRLSESIKLVQEMSPTFEKTIGELSLQPAAKLISSWKRLWETVVGDR